MKDIQSQSDHRKIDIQKVGVKTISYPIVLQDKENICQHTVASVNMYVNLPHQFKGTHMSRFVEILNDFHGSINLDNFKKILERMKDKLEAQEAHLEIEFPFFMNRSSKNRSSWSQKYTCSMHGSLQDKDELQLDIVIPLSGNEHGNVKIDVKFNHFIWIEDLIMLVETSIEKIYRQNQNPDNFLSVDQINGAVSAELAKEKALSWFSVTTERKVDSYTAFATTQC